MKAIGRDMSGKPRVGYIGVGLMGHGAAKNILLKGYALSVLGHRNRTPVDDLVARGASEVLTPAALVAASDTIFLCLPSSTEVEHIMLGAQGIIAAARPGMVIVDSTTADPNSTRRLGAMLAQKGCGYVDGPLSRTPNEAEMGRLSTYLAGEPAHVARVRPIIETYAEVIVEVGALGAAHTMKLVNNMISIGTASVIAEAVATAHRFGVDLRKLFEMVSAGPANSAMFQAMMPWVLEGDTTRKRAARCGFR